MMANLTLSTIAIVGHVVAIGFVSWIAYHLLVDDDKPKEQ